MKTLAIACVVTAVSVASVMAQPSQVPAQPSQPAQIVGQNPHAMTKPDIEKVQEALVKAGYKTPTDGVWTDDSTAALVSFQANRALPATHGGIDGSTLSALGLGGKL